MLVQVVLHDGRLPSLSACFFFLRIRRPPRSPLFPYTTLSRSRRAQRRPAADARHRPRPGRLSEAAHRRRDDPRAPPQPAAGRVLFAAMKTIADNGTARSEEHTSELQSQSNLVCRLLLEKKTLDLGRGALFNQEFYKFAFRATPLRNVELTAPYMHDGAFPTLEAVLKHYTDVPRALREYDTSQLPPALQQMYHGDDATIAAVLTNLDGRLTQPLNLSDVEIGELVAFLKSLTDPAARDLTSLIPARVPSGLPVQE